MSSWRKEIWHLLMAKVGQGGPAETASFTLCTLPGATTLKGAWAVPGGSWVQAGAQQFSCFLLHARETPPRAPSSFRLGLPDPSAHHSPQPHLRLCSEFLGKCLPPPSRL